MEDSLGWLARANCNSKSNKFDELGLLSLYCQPHSETHTQVVCPPAAVLKQLRPILFEIGCYRDGVNEVLRNVVLY